MTRASGPFFGLPAALTASEAAALRDYLRQLWQITYGAAPDGALSDDLTACKRYFDPVARGLSLRDRLASLLPAPPTPPQLSAMLDEPLIVRVDSHHVLVGVEARLTLEALASTDSAGGLVQFGDAIIAASTAQALSTYRSWSRHRLDQVIALRQGRGEEVMQAVAVGFVLALLVNRSTDRARAVPIQDQQRPDTSADHAVFRALEAFATRISERNDRSSAQQRLKSGYAVTEAGRRLGELLRRERSKDGPVLYIPPGSENTVVVFLAADLARRPRLTGDQLANAFDALVAAYRDAARSIALHTPAHERPASTAALRTRLLADFETARQNRV